MTTVNGDPFAAINTGTTGATPTAKKADTLGQADFMRLMTQQLANQDPLKPLSNSEFVAQLAQFSTVQGISDAQREACRGNLLTGAGTVGIVCN